MTVNIALYIDTEHEGDRGDEVEAVLAAHPIFIQLLSQVVLKLAVMPLAKKLEKAQDSDAGVHVFCFVLLQNFYLIFRLLFVIIFIFDSKHPLVFVVFLSIRLISDMLL